VHRRLWPALARVGSERADWQMRGLGIEALALLKTVDEAPARSVRAKSADLEKRLLLRAHEVHTETGAHAKELESWTHFAARENLALPSLEDAKRALEACADALAARYNTRVRLPWR